MKKMLSLVLVLALLCTSLCTVFAEDAETVTAPTKLTSQAQSETAIALSWGMSKVGTQDTGLGIKNYLVYEGSTLVKTVEKTEVTRPGCVITGLEPGSTHTYKVKAVSDNNVESEFSAEATFKTKLDTESADVALGKAVRTNSVGSDPFRSPDAAVNGMLNYTLRSNVWRSASDTNDKYLSVDLGKPYRLSHFVIKDAKSVDSSYDNSKNIIIQGSNDYGDYVGTRGGWKTLAHSYDRKNEAMFNVETLLTASPDTYRYIRVLFPSNGEQTQVELAEFEVYCAPVDEIVKDLAQPYIPNPLTVVGTSVYVPITGGAKVGDDSVYTIFVGEGADGAISDIADTIPCTASIDRTYGNASAKGVVSGLTPGKTYRIQVQLYDTSRTQWSKRSDPRTVIIPTQGGVNVALGRPVFTDKENAERPVKCITDGNREEATGIPYHYINYLDANKTSYAGVDLQNSRAFNKVVLSWPGGKKPASYTLQASNDYAVWTDLGTNANASVSGNIDTFVFDTAQIYRYVRVFFNAYGSYQEIRFGEIEVYSAPETLNTINAEGLIGDKLNKGESAEIDLTKVKGTLESGRNAVMNEAILTLSSSEPTVAAVEGNTIKGISAGSADITVTANLYGTERTYVQKITVADDFWVGGIKFTDQNGNEITAINGGVTTLNTKVSANPVQGKDTFTLVVAVYKNGELQKVLNQKLDLSASTSYTEAELSVAANCAENGITNGCVVKAFLISGFDKLVPYCGSAKIEYK